MSNKKKAIAPVDTVDVVSPFDAEVAEASGETAGFDMFGKRWILHRHPNALHMARMARINLTNPAALAVYDRMIEWCLQDQADDFREAYDEAVYAASLAGGDESQLLGDVIGALISGGTGRPPA